MRKGDGLGSQETRCREYAQLKGYEVVEVFRDEGASGSMIQRPGMLSMLAFLKQHRRSRTHAVLIDDISRLARGLDAHIQLRTAISSVGGKLESPSIEFGEDSDSMLVENLLASVSQHQRQKNAEQTRNRMRARAANGYWGFGAPVGYRYEKLTGHTGKVMVPDEPLATTIREALEGFASGRYETQAEVQRFLLQCPHFPKDRKGEVHPQRVASLLTQVLYASYLSMPEWNLVLQPAKHEALISYETFTRIQERLEGRTTTAPVRRDANEDFPLRGFVVCGCCGHPLTAAWSRGKGGRYAYYSCYQKDCAESRKSIRKEKIEGAFDELLDSICPSEDALFTAHAMFKELWDSSKASAQQAAGEARRELEAVEGKIGQLLERIVEASSDALVDAYETQIEKLAARKALLSEKAAANGSPRKPFEESFRTAFNFLANPRVLWDSGRADLRKTLLRLTFTGRVAYDRLKGFRTPETTLPFKALRDLGAGDSGLARRGRFELPTPRFVVWCSIQLSYRRKSHGTAMA